MKEIELSNGAKTTIDDEWYPILSKWKWQCHQSNGKQYAYRKIGRRGSETVFMHRYIKMANARSVVDHINGNGLDNRDENLRTVFPKYNYWNRGPQQNNKTGFKGVSWDTQRKKYMAAISANGRQKNLGRFDAPEEAARAYDAAAKVWHGQYARPNYPILQAIAGVAKE